jgi:hypothetical protein
MLVYRFETEDGSGPYFGDGSNRFPSSYHNDKHPLPTPRHEIETDLGKFWNNNKMAVWEQYQCGFTSLDQLFAWFPRQKLKLAAKRNTTGIGISCYEVPEELVFKGKYQCMFKRTEAQRVDRVAPDGYNDRELEGIPELCSLISPTY